MGLVFLVSSLYISLRGSHNSFEIQQQSDKTNLGLDLFTFVYIFDLGFGREVGSSSRLLSYFIVYSPT